LTPTSPATSTSSGISISSTTSSSAASSTTPSGPVHVASTGNYTWVGCYTDQIGNRALTALTETNHVTMTVEICGSFCSAYAMFGVEYSR
jgi:iron transport multicopper oxidase